ncbi:MAG: DUF4115 domain-containing protein [Gammaproteobacteria bacterium]|nr:DUF4115 domain-containing protein [Gammaproteobacteria bacterium]MDH4313804.1 DUF4115 domain-containing protein [Gammaproteobacteria bacterium]MDH5214805.1 DUF4115 domain-containing protein [Gammaproteobacteria bacterium]
MADNADDSGEQEVAEPKAGQRLAKARRANDISMRDIAKELHLDEVKVQALEDNRFEVLGAPVFAKGYLRKYAELVSVPIDDILADYYKMNRASGPPPVVGPKRPKAVTEFALGRWIAGIIIVIALAAATYWFVNRPVLVSASPPTKPTQMPVRQPLPANQESAGAGLPADNVTQDPAADLPASEPAIPAVTARATEPDANSAAVDAAADDELQLQLRFTGDCWTEVTDVDGRRLFFGLGSDGRVVNLSGVPPLRLLLGNNDNVSLLVDGEPYAVRPAELRGNTARLTIGGP